MDTEKLTQYNREFFDKAAESLIFETPWIRDLVNHIIDFIRENKEWIGVFKDPNCPEQGLKMLDYACGDGAASKALISSFSVFRGIDISSGMVSQYNATGQSQGFSPQTWYAVQGNLLEDSEALKDPDLQDFDLVVISMALHHVPPQEMVHKLAGCLRPGGTLLVIDFVKFEVSGGDLPAVHTMTRHGFTKQEVLDLFAGAKLQDEGHILHPEMTTVPDMMGGKQRLFLARARTALGSK
ncbi:S-adenosyl-L-methionine-dependent methyltransferase [Pseudomassariella vexata]|uniref:S-adenosyl-L-methionine-dependent methyltransferase n=1 Tax=Pseudomassariella vexata TaxID=1141098 RepID=A0A1Y2DTL9_9PEZI|nr:S-adenosyl-L-methionine-dependent methyltransferase [Pseudomassariella vexata]ORY62600.1 S-adenosyl-L-methionine-dependent methyltransferase [Pseudomassariella vexata]